MLKNILCILSLFFAQSPFLHALEDTIMEDVGQISNSFIVTVSNDFLEENQNSDNTSINLHNPIDDAGLADLFGIILQRIMMPSSINEETKISLEVTEENSEGINIEVNMPNSEENLIIEFQKAINAAKIPGIHTSKIALTN